MKMSWYAQAGAHCKYHVLLPEIMVSVSIASLVHSFIRGLPIDLVNVRLK